MASLRAFLFNLYLKKNMKARPLHLLDPEILREGADGIAPKKTPDAITREDVDMNGVSAERHRAKDADDNRTILYFHGGGYVFGSPKYARGLTFRLAEIAYADVYSVDYRLGPEHYFPAAVDDAVASYRWLLDQGKDPKQITFAGDSAGGGLSLALMLSCKEFELPMPRCAVLYSPFTDLAATGPSLLTNEKSDVMFKKVYIKEGAKRYLGDADPKTPLASPLYGDLTGLPPMLIYASEDEALLDDSTRLYHKLNEAGVEAKLIVEKGLAHVWPMFYPRFPEAGKTITQSADYIIEQTA